MGIRFHCPNGHKLHVKEFLAGKRGICPDCDARFIVPESSGLVAVPVDAADESEPSPAVDPIPENQAAAAPPAAPPIVDSSSVPKAASAPKTDQHPPDSWFVRSASGEQYGPASAEQMRAWATEGRIADDSLVWQTGWDQWKPAAEALGTFQVTPPEPAPSDKSTDSPHVESNRELELQPPNAAITPRTQKSRSENRRVRARKLSYILGSVILLLAAILVIVLWFQK